MSKKNITPRQKRGYPLPLGATHLAEGVNFSLFCRHGKAIELVIIFDENPQGQNKQIEYKLSPLVNKTGDIWHILLELDTTDFSYGFRISGISHWGQTGHVFNSRTFLIDPYSYTLTSRKWGEHARYGETPCCRLIKHDFDWQDDQPPKTPLSETIIYELHVRGFTKNLNSEVNHPGTYRGVIEKIPYLQSLGITAVELMPVTEFDENDNFFFSPDSGEKLKNFWGYNPVSFFALKSGYASNPQNHINEFKEMVLALHQAGIEVILDIVYNHTGEGGYDGNTSSFRGIDNATYYMLDPLTFEYMNFSGCGNTMNCNHPVVRELIRKSLRYWVVEMHVDGFRFDLASILGRDTDGEVLPNPPMIELIAEDPVLRDTKIIAEAWDAAGLYQVGSFSNDARWGEWNGKFRDDVRSFLAGHDNSATKLATRIAGSSDLYQSGTKSPCNSINLLTSHDGFTLYDLVSYDRKHNTANGEDNRDGDNHNLSWNSGHEGDGAPQDIERYRFRRMRTMALILFLSQGVPMITAGDEFGRSQKGNNNAWCQDNDLSWLDWSMVQRNEAFWSFFRKCIKLRRDHVVFRREDFFKQVQTNTGTSDSHEIIWVGLDGNGQDWSPHCHHLALLLNGKTEGSQRDDDFYLVLNGSREDEIVFSVPALPNTSQHKRWHLIIDTTANPPKDFYSFPTAPLIKTGSSFTLASMGAMVFQSRK